MRRAVTIMWLLCFVLSFGALIASCVGSISLNWRDRYASLGGGSCYFGKYRCTTPSEQARFAGRRLSLGNFKDDGWRWKPGIRYFQNQRIAVGDLVVPLYIPSVVFLCLFGGSLTKLLIRPRVDPSADLYARGGPIRV